MTNDLCSWDKERRFATENNKLYVSNAIWVIMQERSVGLEDAKEVCRALIRKNIEKHLDVVKNAKDGSQYSPDLVRFLDAMTYTISGNVAWSMSCPRYNIDAQYSPQQQEWMANGIPDHLRREKRTRPLKAQPRCTPLIQAADASISNSESASSDSSSSSTTPTTPSELCFSTDRDVFLDRHLSPLSREVSGVPFPFPFSQFQTPMVKPVLILPDHRRSVKLHRFTPRQGNSQHHRRRPECVVFCSRIHCYRHQTHRRSASSRLLDAGRHPGRVTASPGEACNTHCVWSWSDDQLFQLRGMRGDARSSQVGEYRMCSHCCWYVHPPYTTRRREIISDSS